MAIENECQLEAICQALGPNGRFTKFQFFLIWFGFLPIAFQLMSNIFIGLQVPHRCSPPINTSDLLEPFQHYNNVSVVYKQCEIQIKSEDKVLKTESCLYGMEYDEPVQSSFVSEFDLVCDETNLGSLTESLMIIGQAFGAVVGAAFSDRLGRKTVLIASNFGLLVTGLIVAYAPNYAIFAASKFVVGAFQQALKGLSHTILLELMVIKDRRISATCGGIFWVSGLLFLGLISFLLKGNTWRAIQMVLSLASLAFIVQWCFLKESLCWMLANGKTQQAMEYIESAAKMNGKNSEEALKILLKNNGDDQIEMPPSVDASEKTPIIQDLNKHKKMTYWDMFKTPRLLMNTLVMWIAWFTTGFGFFTIYLTTDTLPGDLYLNFFLIACMEIPSSIFFYFGLNRYGRKNSLICVYMTMSFGLIGSGIFRSFEATTVNSVLIVIFSMIAMVGAGGSFTLGFSYTPELYPTNIRNQAVGINSLMARVGGVLAPFTEILSEQAEWAPGLIIGCLASLVAVLLRFLPETNGKELPQTLDELLEWYKKGKDEKKNGIKNEAMPE